MKKKTYQQPQVEIFEVKTTGIICTSRTPQGQIQSLEDDDYYEDDLF